MKRFGVRLITATLTLMLLLSSISVAMGAEVSYKGKGSRSNPYIVETAEQLDGIRNNLKAHYKLGNTIDLSGIANFKPIGTLAEPFQGSLSCDTDASGKPLYAIKNLKMNVAPEGCTLAEGFSGYKEKKSGWEAGMFGYAQGASFKNILVLDATVTSKVEGCYQMNGDYTVNPGTDEQATAILLAMGNKVTISGCGVSGSVTSASNHTGGLAGYLDDSTVSKSYSYANVTSTGAWSSGGFVGTIIGTKVNTSFYSGVFSGGQTHAGAFVGDCYKEGSSSVTDCWAEGTVKTEDSGCFAGTKNHSDDDPDVTNVVVCKNTYTLCKIEGRKNAQTNKKVTNNNYITNEVGGFEVDFAAASQAEMNAAFKDLPNWTVTDGQYPQIKGLVATKDAASYTVQAVTEEPATPGTTSDTASGTTSGAGDANEPGSVDGDEQSGDADVQVNTVFDNTLTSLRGGELALVISLAALVVATMIAAVVVFVIVLKRNTPAKDIDIYSNTDKEE